MVEKTEFITSVTLPHLTKWKMTTKSDLGHEDLLIKLNILFFGLLNWIDNMSISRVLKKWIEEVSKKKKWIEEQYNRKTDLATKKIKNKITMSGSD